MKSIFLSFFTIYVFLSGDAFALESKSERTVYVYGRAGNDAWSGFLEDANHLKGDGPKKTIQSAYDSLRGDSGVIVVAKGRYHEQVSLARGRNVIIRSSLRDSGRVVVDGADLIENESWRRCDTEQCGELIGGKAVENVYYVDISYSPNQLFQNGKRLKLARFPDDGYIFPSVAGRAMDLISSDELAGITFNLGGSVCHVKTAGFSINHIAVESHYGNSVKLKSPARHFINENSGFFFTNVPAALKKPGQWALSASKNRIYLYSYFKPLNVYASRFDYGVRVSGHRDSSFHIVGLRIENQNKGGVFIDGYGSVEIENNEISNPYVFGVLATGAERLLVRENRILNANSVGVSVSDNSKNVSIVNNYIYATGAEFFGDDLIVGRGVAISNYSRGVLISNNRIDKTGYTAIYLGQDVSGSDISYNYITEVMLALSDGGGIYTGRYFNSSMFDSIHHNIVEGGYGYKGGVSRSCSKNAFESCIGSAYGIYLDERTSQRKIEFNTVVNATRGLFLHWGGGNFIQNNVFFGNRSSQVLLSGKDKDNYRLKDVVFKGNFLISNRIAQSTLEVRFDPFSIDFGRSDGNYYLNPFRNDHLFIREPLGGGGLSLIAWKRLSGQDGGSVDVALNNKKGGVSILTNPSMATIGVSPSLFDMCDVHGDKLNEMTFVLPYESLVFFPCR